MPGAERALAHFLAKGVPMVLATSSSRETVEKKFAGHPILRRARPPPRAARPPLLNPLQIEHAEPRRPRSAPAKHTRRASEVTGAYYGHPNPAAGVVLRARAPACPTRLLRGPTS